MNWNPTTLVLLDEVTDQERASDGVSRYGVYLAAAAQDFQIWPDADAPHTDPAYFAVTAWRIATSPIMDPAYAVTRPDLTAITAHIDDEAGDLVVDIAVPLTHRALARRPGYPWQDWRTSRPVTGDPAGHWPRTPPPGPRCAILTTATVRLNGRDWPLPTPTATSGPTLLAEAKQAIEVIADRVNTEAGHIVAQLLAGESR
ncbi:hypothetical protein [Wenjunlia vitaminophila]|uniref:hypothetical protein n=1 Tax=Wenjunlia vitaminophila TaxID=76728 RepID=UPI00036C65CF|nr:hypothetical protein [Wenjunlia vitaminophila]